MGKNVYRLAGNGPRKKRPHRRGYPKAPVLAPKPAPVAPKPTPVAPKPKEDPVVELTPRMKEIYDRVESTLVEQSIPSPDEKEVIEETTEEDSSVPPKPKRRRRTKKAPEVKADNTQGAEE